jgi:phosphate transport system ATP-binding protein
MVMIMDNVIDIQNVNLWYGDHQALFDVSMPVQKNKVTALIGPSGCGKSTLIRSINRMNDLIDSCRVEGRMMFHGEDIYGPGTDVIKVRKKIGMIFQKPNPFPMSVRDNITYGPKIHGITDKDKLEEILEKSLREAALWEEVRDRLDKSAMSLSGGQQQRLCIARTLAVSPEVILMDEPTSALDPIATSKIEDLITELVKEYTVVIVTHNMQQAARISDYTGFMYIGEMVEFDKTDKIFQNPSKEMTDRYISGRFG